MTKLSLDSLLIRIIDLNHRYGRRFSERDRQFVRVCLPYCLHPVGDGPSPLIWLNRSYSPLGKVEYANYHDYSYLHIDCDDPLIAALIPRCKKVIGGICNQPIFFLYDDSNAPWVSRKNLRRYLGLWALVFPPCA